MRAITTLQLVVNSALLILATWASAIPPPVSIEGLHTACDSLECASLAAQIASYMNSTVEPCTDFYNYSCGNINNAVKHSPSKSATADLLYDENYLNQAHQSDFMNERLIRGVYKMLALNSMPTSNDADITELYEFTRNFYKSCGMWIGSREINIVSVRNLNGIYRHMVRTLKNVFNKDYAIESILAALVMTGDNNGYLSVSPFSEFIDNALDHMDNNLMNTARAVVQLIIPYNNSIFTWHRHEELIEYFNSIVDSEFSFRDIKATFNNLFAAESNWTMYNLGISCLDKYDNQYDFALSQLDSISACVQPKNPFSWSNFFGALLEAKLDFKAIFKVPDLVKVIGYANYMKTRHTARNKPVSEEVALLIFDWLLGFSQFFTKYLMNVPLVQRRASTDIHMYGIGEGSKPCQDLTFKMLSPIVGRMFQKAYHREDISDIRQLIKKIKTATINSLRRQAWISPNSKEAIAHKIERIPESIGVFNARALKTFYKALLEDYRVASKDNKEGSMESKFGSLLAIASLSNRRRTWQLMSGMKNISLYMYSKIAHSGLTSLMLNVFGAQRQKNKLLFTMVSDDTLLYHYAYPDYIKLGTLAYAISHEIGNSFNLQGHEVQHKDKVGQFWDKKMVENFHERVDCVRKHYGGYRLYPGGPLNNAVKTANGNIADLIGISAATAAFEALKRQGEPMPMLANLSKSFTADQLFFVKMAQQYCVNVANPGPKPGNLSPAFIRVLGMARNSEAFAKAFNCPRGSPMNPTDKCTFW